jgi:small ligand-binding sensory domain FIST
MLVAGAGAAVHADGFTAAGLAAHRALTAAATTSATTALVFAGARHEEDDYAGVLKGVRQRLPGATIVGCSATGVLTSDEELENGSAVAVLVLSGDPRLPSPLVVRELRHDARSAGARLGRAALDALGGNVQGAALAVLVDPGELDAADFILGVAESAPGLLLTGAGASGGSRGSRVFFDGAAHADTCVALVLPPSIHPTLGMTQGCQGLSDPMTITAANGNLILEIEGRSPQDILRNMLADPRNRALGSALAEHLLAGIGDLISTGRSDYVVRPFAVTEDDDRTLAVAEPVRAGQTIRFTLRDAIGARDDMKAMLDEQASARGDDMPRFGVYFNCAGRGSALYGQPGLDPELIRRRFGKLPVIGIESSFEIAPACGRPRIHMFTGVLLLAG